MARTTMCQAPQSKCVFVLGVDAWVHVGEFGGPHDSDDFIGVCGVVFQAQAKAAADRVFPRKILFRESLVDHGDLGRSCGVRALDAAAKNNRDAHGAEEIRTYPLPVHPRLAWILC